MDTERGILSKQGIFFHQASESAKERLQYLLWGGEYLCDSPYRVDRDSLDSLLCFSILEGRLHFSYRGEEFDAIPGEIVLLDCKRHNLYYAESPVRFAWFHFAGGASQLLCDWLYEQQGCHVSGERAAVARREAGKIMGSLYLDRVDDFSASAGLYALLCSLFPQGGKEINNPAIRRSIRFMREHLHRSLTLEELSRQENLSLYHYARLFTSQTGLSPHAYLLNLRIGAAKALLVEKSDSVERIAEQCGFNSASHFIRAFRQKTGYTPLAFRKMEL